ncbi:hypothetical protein [Vallitalea guaymasensis]|uniref:hypothetical protein n=1 Tax=Vallitalea guaymasensis TaxID=1185412 RepID=UPI000DE49D90|nr:hypothetical protein [Vallitalea guaymasensis]
MKAYHYEFDTLENVRNEQKYINSIDTLEEEGYNNEYPIVLDLDGEVIDGNHRLAACYDLDILRGYIPIIVIDSKLLFDNGLMDNEDDEESFYSFCKKNGEKLSYSQVTYENGIYQIV